MTDPQQPTPPRRRRWYQFSLRTLMIVMLLASIGMSWFAVKMQQARRQREAVAAIIKAGGTVDYDYEEAARSAGRNPALEEPPGPRWLQEILGVDFFASVNLVSVGPDSGDVCLKQLTAMPNLKLLDLHGAGVTDDGLSQLPQLPQLQTLDLQSNKVTDDGLAYLARLPQLAGLNLSDNRITDNGLACLVRLPQLEVLIVDNNKITDDGLAHLARLPKLQILALSRLPITDAGVQQLKGLNRLEWLNLSGTRVSAGGEAELQKALRGCMILRLEYASSP